MRLVQVGKDGFAFLSVLMCSRGILGVPSSAPEQMDAGWLWESHHGVRVVVEAGITTRSNPHPEEAHLEYSLMSYCSCHGSSLILEKVGTVVELELLTCFQSRRTGSG